MPDGRLRYTMKKPWADGTHALLFEPLAFIARLVLGATTAAQRDAFEHQRMIGDQGLHFGSTHDLTRATPTWEYHF
jgi:hypothetical protein